MDPIFLYIGIAVLFLLIGFFLGRQKPDTGLKELQGALAATLDQQKRTETAFKTELETRLGGMSTQTTQAISSLGERTQSHLSNLQERLAVIDSAQTQMGSLTKEVTDLRLLLSNKQTRGAFGEMRMVDILENVFPANAFSLQHTLSNGKRVDALLLDDHSGLPIPIDAKFPLESYKAILESDTKDSLERARRTFKQDMKTHIKAVSEKYILPGETGESALLFLPAESIYAELHAHFEDVVLEAMKAKVWIVSPTTLMAVLVTLRGIARDSLVFKEADNIRKELDLLGKDVGRLLDRSGNLARHLEQVHGDLDGISTSAHKIQKRATSLSSLEFGE